jgi:MFS family permease
VGSYARILRTPHLATLLGASMLARLPIGINAVATVLFLREQTGSFAIAGAAAGGLALGIGLGAPVGARLIDRLGKGVLLALAAGHATGIGALVLLGLAGAPAPALVAAAIVTGILMPPTSSVMRALYPRLLDEPAHVQAAYALDSVSTQVIFVAGPLLTAVIVTLFHPEAALALSAATVVIGTVVFLAALPPDERHRSLGAGSPHLADRLGALRAPGIRTIVMAMVPVGFAFGSLEVALPAFADAEGHRELAGVLLAFWSAGSAIGGLFYGARARRSPLARVHVRMAMLLPIGIAPLALAGSIPTAALLAMPAGLFIAPLIATRNELAGKIAPPGTETEAYTWPLTALVAGVSLGAGVAGALADATSARVPLMVAAGAAAIGAAIALARRGTLEKPAPAAVTA